MLRASGAMGAATLASRLLGMVREMVYARFMGNGWVASAFIFAFQIPNLFRRLLGEGALTAAFIPIFKLKEKTEGEAAMWRASNAVISGLIVFSAILCGAAMLVITLILKLKAGWTAEDKLMLELLRLMFPYMLLVCVAAALMGMCNARGHFFIPALGSTMLNVVMIGSVLWLAPQFGPTLETQIFGLAVGVLVAGVAQALFQVPTLWREGHRYRWVSPWGNPVVRQVVIQMIPGSIGVAAFQINVLITQSFSYWYEPTIVSTFNYAVRLIELPQGLFGISLATFLLPTLSGLAAEKNFDEFRTTLRHGIGYLAFVNLIAGMTAYVLAEPIVRLIFEGGKFHADATVRVGLAMLTLAPGLIMFSLVNILARAFYALHDLKTPMKISLGCMALNLGLSLWLVQPLHEAGLGLANTISATLNAGLLLYFLRRKMGGLELGGLVLPLLWTVAAVAVSGVLGQVLSDAWEQHFGHASLWTRMGAVFVPMTFLGLFYMLLGIGLKIPAAQDIVSLVRSRARRLLGKQG